MLDLTKEIADLLKGIVPVELAGSEKELELPSIYIDMVSNVQDTAFEGKDFLTRFTYQLDIYAETPQKCVDIAKAVDTVMQCEGWQRSNGALIGRQRYMLTYSAIVSEKYHVYKE